MTIAELLEGVELTKGVGYVPITGVELPGVVLPTGVEQEREELEVPSTAFAELDSYIRRRLVSLNKII